MSILYLVKYECQKTGGNLKYVLRLMTNHKVVKKHLSCDGLLHCEYIIQFAGERIFKIVEHLEKLQAKWLIASYTTFALDICPQRCRTHQISKIICA